jgi:CubicO group peptidase (beta-lactamase class C family)
VLAQILDEGVRSGVVPGGALLAADAGQVALRIGFGRTQIEPASVGEPTTPDHVFDVASLTKPTATVATLMGLVAAGVVDLDAPVHSWLPELCAPGTHAIVVRHLLSHSSGLPAHLKYYERLLAGERLGAATAREALLRMVGQTPLERPPGAASLYSDLGFILLGFVLERATGERLDALARRLVFAPIGMPRTRFVDLLAEPLEPAPAHVVPTEACAYRGLLVGAVHDQNAHAAGGVCGHAGLFSCVDDLSAFAHVMARAANGEAVAGFDPDVVRAFFAPTGVPDSTWRLGWDTPDPTPGFSNAGDRWPRDGVGHLGFTGCSLWIDPPRRRWVVLLTNRIHPVVQDKAIMRQFRHRVMDAVVAQLDASAPGGA